METVRAFQEVGYTLVAVALPILLLASITAIRVSIRRKSRKMWEEARGSRTAMGAVVVVGIDGIPLVFGRLTQIILLLLLVLNVLIATVPYGHTHGWW